MKQKERQSLPLKEKARCERQLRVKKLCERERERERASVKSEETIEKEEIVCV